MGYFSNGTEVLIYQEKYCFNCKNYIDKKDGRGEGCPIWDLHFLYGYELCNSKSKGKVMLDYLIPEDEEGMNKECSMFLKREERDDS